MPATAGQAHFDSEMDTRILEIIIRNNGCSLCDMLRLLLPNNAHRIPGI